MSEINNGGPAFPNGDDVTLGRYAPHPGMSLRDYFAAKADISLYSPFATLTAKNTGISPTICELAEYIAQIRYIEAEAMLAEREKQK